MWDLFKHEFRRWQPANFEVSTELKLIEYNYSSLRSKSELEKQEEKMACIENYI